MKCPSHTKKEVTGYCTACGSLGCEECIKEGPDGKKYCPKCIGGVAPSGRVRAPSTPEAARVAPTRTREGRRLVVHYRDGKILKGTTYRLDPKSTGFYLTPVDSGDGDERPFVWFTELKAVFVVKDYDGMVEKEKTDKDSSGPVVEPRGQEVVITFGDGEVLEGVTLQHFEPDCQRFYLTPKDQSLNNISVLVERAFISKIVVEGTEILGFAPEVPETRRAVSDEEELPVPVQGKVGQGESMGDFYFSMKDYNNALKEYLAASEKGSDVERLTTKVSICYYNVGISHIRARNYQEALRVFRQIPESDPVYQRARRKIRKLVKAVEESPVTENS